MTQTPLRLRRTPSEAHTLRATNSADDPGRHRDRTPISAALPGRRSFLSGVRAPGGTARSKLVQVIVAALSTMIVLLLCVVVGLVLARQLIVLATTALSPAGTANRAIMQVMTDSQSSLRGYQLTDDPAILKLYQDSQPSLMAALDSLDAASRDDPELHRAAAAQRVAVLTWVDSYARRAAAGPVPNAAEQQGNTAFQAFRASNLGVNAVVRARSLALLERASWIVLVTLITLVVVLVVGTVCALVPALRALRLIGPPLEALETTVDRIRAGDAGARSDPTLGVREIQAVSQAVNELATEQQRRQLRDAEDIRLGTAARVVSSTTNQSLDLSEIGRSSVQAIGEQFGAAAVRLRAFEGRGELSGPGFGCFYPPDLTIGSDSQLVGDAYGLARLIWDRQAHVLITPDDHSTTDLFAPGELERIRRSIFEGTDLASVVVIPVGVGSDCLGYLSVARSVGQPAWSPPEIDVLMSTGSDIGRAIVHARLLERETVLVSELKHLDATKNDFVSMVSHELRTPLASIIGHLEIVRTGPTTTIDPDTELSLQAIDRNAIRLTCLIEDLLLLSRIEQRKQPAPRRPVDLVAVVLDMAAMHAEPAAQKGIALELSHEGQAVVTGDEMELERIVSNLIGNAIKYSAAQTTIRVTVTGRADDVTVAVADQGIGLSTADRRRLFERFFRSSDPAAQAVPGTGLGLAISKLLVDNHGGTIEVESELRRGSVFTVTLPKQRRNGNPSEGRASTGTGRPRAHALT